MMLTGLKDDIIAGFSVFLLALPLCLGIAIASNFPPIAGIFTAIIGGVFASCLGSAPLTIKGPAAGLIVMVLGAVHELGQGDIVLGYKLTLAVGVVAALLQIGIALSRKAVIAEIIPPFVIHGMLAAIGVIIISKQAYVWAGLEPTSREILKLIIEFPGHFLHLNPLIFAIGLLSMAIIIFWPKMKSVALVPSSIALLVVVIPLSLYFGFSEGYSYSFLGAPYHVGGQNLVNLPSNFLHAIQFPDFSQLLSVVSLKYIIMFSLIGSIESLLTVCAVDSLSNANSPAKPPSNLNKDLMATGFANLVSACIGGLPMISEIVRSKANIDYGATSVRANFFHGLFLLIAVILIPSLINLIPLSALAALLIFVGLRLASPHQFTHAYAVGRDQFVVFMTTFIVTLAIDLLVGVALGILVKILIHWIRGHSLAELVSPTICVVVKGDRTIVQIDGSLTFISFLKVKNVVEKLAKEKRKITISLAEVTYIDHTVMSKIQTLTQQIKDVELTIEDNHQLVPFYNHPLSSRGLR
jgi:MFS superfamily sulfate permease-like transporter